MTPALHIVAGAKRTGAVASLPSGAARAVSASYGCTLGAGKHPFFQTLSHAFPMRHHRPSKAFKNNSNKFEEFL
jgi:hypothetical protein